MFQHKVSDHVTHGSEQYSQPLSLQLKGTTTDLAVSLISLLRFV
jgi:hypothetical protein